MSKLFLDQLNLDQLKLRSKMYLMDSKVIWGSSSQGFYDPRGCHFVLSQKWP